MDEYVEVEYIAKMRAKRTNTTGRHSWVVAQACGGVQEHPEVEYRNPQLILADDESEACMKYDQLNNCSYYYGAIIAQVD